MERGEDILKYASASWSATHFNIFFPMPVFVLSFQEGLLLDNHSGQNISFTSSTPQHDGQLTTVAVRAALTASLLPARGQQHPLPRWDNQNCSQTSSDVSWEAESLQLRTSEL